MNINKIKEDIKKLVGTRISILVNVGRNKEESFEGVLINTYPSLFTVKVGELTKSFSYSDVMIKDVVIKKI